MKRLNLVRLARLRADDSGAAAVEFAIVASAFISLLMGISYFAIMAYTRATLQWAVEATIRDAAINPDATQTQLTTTLNNHLSALNVPPATVNYSTAAVGTVQVATLTASFTQTYTIPLVGTFNHTYTATGKTPQNDDD
jgi:Flp pilus assembly protein TadG